MSSPAVSTRRAHSYKAAADILSKRDPVLRRLVAQAGPLRVNPPTETHFAALVRGLVPAAGRCGGTRHPWAARR
jgi:hypothetical protein